MPFRLCNAPATFQRVMDLTLTGIKWKKCLVYLDDVVIFGRTFQEHFNNLAECPHKNRSKQDRDSGVMANSNQHVRARPLHRLTEQGRQFSWSNEAEEALQRLKRALTTAPILAFPRFDIPFVIDTDASETGIGAVLSQKHDPEGERVIAYASRTLSKTDWKYSTTRKELLSIVYFTKLFRPYLVGQRFTLRTDHDSLTWLRNFKEPEGQVARWLEHLQEYDMEVVHRRGRQHNNADAMSRRPEVTEDNGDHPTTEMPSAAVGTAAVSLASNEGAEPLEAPQDENIECVIRFLRRGRRPTDSEWRELHKESRDLVKQWKHLWLTPAGLAVVVTEKPARWVPPNHARPSILEQLHNGICGGHLGVKKTAEKVRSRYFWPGWYRDVKAWCDRCEACARGKTPPIVNRAPMESLVVGKPMEIVAVELLRPAPRSKNGNSYIMVVTDYFTRWVEAYAFPNQLAETVARKLMQQFVCRFGTSMKLLSDQGTQFQGRLVPKLCKILGRPPRLPVDAAFNTNFGKRNDHQQIRRRVGSLPPKCVRGRPETQCGGTEAAKIVKEVSGLNYRIRSISNPRRTLLVHVNRLKPCELTSAQLCSLRQKYNEDKQQVRRDHQSKTKPRIYRPRLVWDEEDHGHDGTSTQAMVAQRPQRNRYPPVRYNDYVFY
ncbi:Retrovirus-related Pol polyprotein from transposon [Trichinella sp. T9]|nr:Retrovirus-related Pol polyprotein from transposon [Trichinella sp. T9]